jgi:glutamine synthetase
LCQVRNSDDSYHETNTRTKLAVSKLSSHSEIPGENDLGFWWGFEQEYFVTDGRRPVGFPAGSYPEPQGRYYCGVGGSKVNHRDLAMDHMYECLERGIEITGVNAEVALSQWEYQVFSRDTLKACDDLWMSRYLLHRLAEQHGVGIDMSPKPLKGDWNGSGCHTNFSNVTMREGESKKYFTKYLDNLEASHDLHIASYGADNEERLTGEHETQHIDKFTFGLGDRGASVRIPNSVVKNNWCGYLEDRRPASNCDPYSVARLIIEAAP